MMKSLRIAALLFAGLLFSAPAWADTNASTREVVESTVNKILSVLDARTDKTTLSDIDIAAIKQIAKERINYRYIASRLLGKSGWSTLDKTQQEGYTARYSEWIELYIANQLSKYNGQPIEYDRDEVEGRLGTVKLLVDNNGKLVHLDFTLRRQADDAPWMIIDFTVEGVSIPRSVESDFRLLIDGKEGYQAVMARLDELIETKKDTSTD